MARHVSVEDQITSFRAGIERKRMQRLARNILLRRGKFMTREEWKRRKEGATAILPWISWKLYPEKYPRPEGIEPV